MNTIISFNGIKGNTSFLNIFRKGSENGLLKKISHTNTQSIWSEGSCLYLTSADSHICGSLHLDICRQNFDLGQKKIKSRVSKT